MKAVCLIIQPLGRFYEGEWKSDVREGAGFERYANGNTYEGGYKEGRANGKGTYTWVSGETYNGQWSMGMKHGQGVWKTANGEAKKVKGHYVTPKISSYIGEW